MPLLRATHPRISPLAHQAANPVGITRQSALCRLCRSRHNRHTSASLLLLANVHPKIVQERLGHASIRITLDIYSHLLPSSQQLAVVALEGVIGGPLLP